jgi:hypothetical protein
MRNDAASAAALLCFLDVMALGGAWYACGNLVAPVVGALAINAVDWHHFHQVRLLKGDSYDLVCIP